MFKGRQFAPTRRTALVQTLSLAAPLALPGFSARLAAQETSPTSGGRVQLQELQSLEERASKAGISIPERKSGVPGEDETYSELMPRLVDLIDRSSSAGEEGAAIAKAASDLLTRVNFAERGQQPDEFAAKAAPDFGALEGPYREQYEACQVLPQRQPKVDTNMAILMRYRQRYEKVATPLTIPWYFIGIIHGLEASFNFEGHLHNGDTLAKRTVHEPKSRPLVWNPPNDWETSATDALLMKNLEKQSDWSLGRLLYEWERYNGFGYYWRNAKSPYLWSFSNQYVKGKYVQDGVWDPEAVSQQCGAVTMLKTLVSSGTVTMPA